MKSDCQSLSLRNRFAHDLLPIDTFFPSPQKKGAGDRQRSLTGRRFSLTGPQIRVASLRLEGQWLALRWFRGFGWSSSGDQRWSLVVCPAFGRSLDE